jgi:hypothetical protein
VVREKLSWRRADITVAADGNFGGMTGFRNRGLGRFGNVFNETR